MPECLKCQIEFQSKFLVQKYCSEKCRKYCSKRRYQSKYINFCVICNSNIVTRNNSKCPSCHYKSLIDKTKELTLEFYIKKHSSKENQHPSWKYTEIRQHCRTWNINLLKYPCQNCSYDKHKEFCHIIPIGDFPITTKLKEVNSPDNILILCPNCHWEFDNHLIDIKDIKPRNWCP